MPVVTTLFRNFFDYIFTIFYGCWTVFNGVGPILTLITPFVTRSIWLVRFCTVQQPWQTAIHCLVCCCARPATHCICCARVACALCMCALCTCVLVYVLVIYVRVRVLVCVHSVVLTLLEWHFGNLFGTRLKWPAILLGFLHRHFLDFFGASML